MACRTTNTCWTLEDQLHAIKEQVGQDAFWLDPRQRSLELCRRVIWSFHDYTRDPNVLLETRRAIAEEIESLQSAPLLVVQTSPPEGTPIPAGPRMVNVRGLVPPGATVKLNGEPCPECPAERVLLPLLVPVRQHPGADDHRGPRGSTAQRLPHVSAGGLIAGLLAERGLPRGPARVVKLWSLPC